jgi:hypothetical protein
MRRPAVQVPMHNPCPIRTNEGCARCYAAPAQRVPHTHSCFHIPYGWPYLCVATRTTRQAGATLLQVHVAGPNMGRMVVTGYHLKNHATHPRPNNMQLKQDGLCTMWWWPLSMPDNVKQTLHSSRGVTLLTASTYGGSNKPATTRTLAVHLAGPNMCGVVGIIYLFMNHATHPGPTRCSSSVMGCVHQGGCPLRLPALARELQRSSNRHTASGAPCRATHVSGGCQVRKNICNHLTHLGPTTCSSSRMGCVQSGGGPWRPLVYARWLQPSTSHQDACSASGRAKHVSGWLSWHVANNQIPTPADPATCSTSSMAQQTPRSMHCTSAGVNQPANQRLHPLLLGATLEDRRPHNNTRAYHACGAPC